MRYIIDTANEEQIQTALSMGVCGVTANPSMYLKNNVDFYGFLKRYSLLELEFLSGEVMGDTFEEMKEEVNKILCINKNIVIKVNFSTEGLKLCKYLKNLGVKVAITLIFDIRQAIAAINAGADYIFPFVGRNEEIGNDGLQIIHEIQQIIKDQNYKTKVVAASIKNLYQLEQLAMYHIDYAAIPYDLLIKSLNHPLTTSGLKTFKEDWEKVEK